MRVRDVIGKIEELGCFASSGLLEDLEYVNYDNFGLKYVGITSELSSLKPMVAFDGQTPNIFALSNFFWN